MKKKIIVVGGGPAGMFAAIAAASNGAEVILIERNHRLGAKLRITGKGRCNITNIAEIETIMENISSNHKFFYSAIYSFTNEQVFAFFNDNGLPLKVERGGRVFPESDNANHVVDFLEQQLQKTGVKIVADTRVSSLIKEGKKILGVKSGNKEFYANAVILCTGGLTYPKTGSSGDGHKILKAENHTITQLLPALVPLEIAEGWVPELMGLALKNVQVTAYLAEKELGQEFGEMLFTHFGVSGPIILTLSNYLTPHIGKDLRLEINLKPALSQEQLDARVLRDLQKFANKQLKNSLQELLPKKLIMPIICLTGIEEEKKCNQITKVQRESIVHILQHLSLHVTKARPMDEAIITKGGVSIKEINASTLESKLLENLYIAGEILDLDAYTGGYNLQIAFSTGYLAGMSAISKEEMN
ncbi:MAG: NAD(P)/FAD-dependent oxidoreductase [Clostridia bacterium]